MRLASQKKRPRLTKEEMAEMFDKLAFIVRDQSPCSIRQVFYRATVGDLGPKDENFYNRADRYLIRMRELGIISYWDITDSTRWMRKPHTHNSLRAMLEESRQLYRRALWRDQPVRVEIWLEKDALAGVVYDVTAEYDVPLIVTRGYSSHSLLYSSAEEIRAASKPTYIYYFGDFDPSGVDIPRKVEKFLRKHAPEAEIHFIRVAVNEEQIRSMNLPTRPTKKSDGRSKNFGEVSVELDAIEPNTLREMVREVIERHIDPRVLEITKWQEGQDREVLDEWMGSLGEAEPMIG